MEVQSMKCQCPYCLAEFEVKQKRKVSEEVRLKRSENMKAIRVNGAPAGSGKKRKERSDKGVKRNGGVSWNVNV